MLLQGESGTGKDLAAESIHVESARRDGPFLVVDCGAIPANLLETELFGYEAGAFTGATAQRIGAFEAASGGTVLLDEIGELALDLQPKLLRAIERREIQRIGGTQRIAVDVRIIAATNRNLKAEVNARRFRSDLYFRLAVLVVTLPPLRDRAPDLPLLVDAHPRRPARRRLGDGQRAAQRRAPARAAAPQLAGQRARAAQLHRGVPRPPGARRHAAPPRQRASEPAIDIDAAAARWSASAGCATSSAATSSSCS